MPELPEVQTIVNQLSEVLTGRTITQVDVRLPKMFYGEISDVEGKKILGIRRRAKVIIFDLEGPKSLAIHLKMTGQLIYGELGIRNKELKEDVVRFPNPIPFAGESLPAKHTHVIFRLDKQGVLFFNDMRQFGWVRVVDDDDLASIEDKHGPEPFSESFTVEYLRKILNNWGRPVKLLLLDQSKIAGVGNIYANEALWCAEVSPMHRGRDLVKDHPEKVQNLYDCIKSILEEGIKFGGSSAADDAFVNVSGMPGKMQEHFNVYQKDGQLCPRNDRGMIRRATIGGRGTFFCPKCQK